MIPYSTSSVWGVVTLDKYLNYTASCLTHSSATSQTLGHFPCRKGQPRLHNEWDYFLRIAPWRKYTILSFGGWKRFHTLVALWSYIFCYHMSTMRCQWMATHWQPKEPGRCCRYDLGLLLARQILIFQSISQLIHCCNTGYSYLVTHPSRNYVVKGLTLFSERKMLPSLW